jgi:hypothetical protein
MAIYFIFSALETIAVALYLALIGSQGERQVFLNLSLSRLLSFAALVVIALAFLVLAIVAIIRHAKGKGLFSGLLSSQRKLLMLFSGSTLLMGLMFFLLTRPPSFGGDLRLVIRQSEPLFSWLLFLAAQTCLFVALWVSAHFIINKGAKSIAETKKELLPVLGLFILALLAKWFIVSAASFAPTGTGDEMTYYDMVDSLNRGFFSIAQTYHYPPLYPLALVPALAFGRYTFLVIKLINAVITTGILFPTYFICRNYLDEKKSLLVALVACLLPYNLIFPRRIVSENLYFPIFLWSMFMVLVKPAGKKTALVWDIFTGVVLGMLYLTRYISFVIIPMYLVAWWLKPFEENDRLLRPSLAKVLRFLLVAAIACAVFSPWVVGALLEKVPVKLVLGFVITSNTTPAQLTITNLLTWVALYTSYMLIMAAPVLPLLFKSLTFVNKDNWRGDFGRLVFQTVILLAAFMMASVRHSWRAYYNSAYPAAIMGRYVLYMSMLFLIVGFVTLDFHQRENRSRALKANLWPLLLSLALVSLAFLITVQEKIIKVGPIFLRPEGSVDAYYVRILGYAFFAFIGALYLLYGLYFTGAKMTLAARFIPLVMLVYFMFGWGDYYHLLIQTQTFPWLSSQIEKQAHALLTDEQLADGISLFVPAGLNNQREAELYDGLRVRALDNTKIFTDTEKNLAKMPTPAGFIVRIYTPADAPQDPGLHLYRFNDTVFTLELVTK